MELKADFDDENASSNNGLQELWPLGEIDPKKARFPFCIVWTPLPVVSWLAPYIGHVGICQEDGAILDFAGSNLCCFPVNLAAHVCGKSYNHSEVGAAISWDDALQSGMRRFQHKFYNLFTCNCHSFVANCLNRIAYKGSMEWNVLNVAALVWFHGQWVDKMSVVRSFLPFLTVTCIGILMAGWSFLIGMAAFSALLIGWFIFTVYCFKGFVC
ncbi:unnamed protein product [Urochloa humidicola]